MVNQKKKGKYIGMAGALVVHIAIIALLILVGFTRPEPSEEGGVPVMLGEVPDALGAADPSLVKVDVMPEEIAPRVQETVEQDIITQETEESVAIKPKAQPKKKEEVKKPEKTEAEKAEEARKLGIQLLKLGSEELPKSGIDLKAESFVDKITVYRGINPDETPANLAVITIDESDEARQVREDSGEEPGFSIEGEELEKLIEEVRVLDEATLKVGFLHAHL